MNRYNDVFHEEIVIRKNQGIFNVLYILFNVFMYIFALFTMFGFQGILQSIGDTTTLVNSLLPFLGFAALTVGIYFYKGNFKMDYEYSFTNGILDIAKVKNNKSRKEILSINTKVELESIAPILTNEFNKYQSMKDIKRINAWLNRDMKKYYAIIRKDKQKIMLIFEPSEKFVATLKKYNPQKIKTQ